MFSVRFGSTFQIHIICPCIYTQCPRLTIEGLATMAWNAVCYLLAQTTHLSSFLMSVGLGVELQTYHKTVQISCNFTF